MNLETESPSHISVVIPTKNAGPEFEHLLELLCHQEVKSNVEVLVVDSGSKDTTLEICRRYPVRVESIASDQFGHGRTRNLGISLTSGEIICLLTQDALPTDSRFLANLVQPFSNQDVAGVVGRQIAKPDASPLTVRDVGRWILGSLQSRVSRITSQNQFEELPPIEQYLLCAFDNVCSAIRRSVWERIPFPDVLFGEDIEWGYRVLRCGYAVAYQPDAAVYHSHDRPIRYQYQRMTVDHYRLCELFGLETVPSVWHIPGAVVRQTVGDLRDLLRMGGSVSARFRDALRVPVRSLAHVAGQYRGARAYRRGRVPEGLEAV